MHSFSLGWLNVLGSPCRSLNVDMEWLYGASEGSNMEVDIGYLPQVCNHTRSSVCMLDLGKDLCCRVPELHNLSYPCWLELSVECFHIIMYSLLICVCPLQQRDCTPPCWSLWVES